MSAERGLFARLRRLWALSSSDDAQPVVERTVVERIIERVPVPSATVDDIYVQAIARLELMPGDILVATLPDDGLGGGGAPYARAARVLSALAEKQGATLLASDKHHSFSVLSFKRAERRLTRSQSTPRKKRAVPNPSAQA